MWAVGSTIQRFHNGSWSTYSVDNGGTLNGAAIDENGLVSAVGYTGSAQAQNRRPLIEKWDGSQWNVVTNPTFNTDSYLTSVDLYDSKHIWAVGSYYSVGDERYETLTEYYNGTSWTVITSPDPGAIDNRLEHVWFDTEGDVYAVGSYEDSYAAGIQTLVLRWNDTNWAKVNTPAPGVSSRLLGVGTIPGNLAVVTSTWGVGSYMASSYGISQTLVEKIQSPAAPDHTTSYYINNLDLNMHYQFGCDAAASQQGGLILLSYGHPADWGTLSPLYGTKLVGPDDEHAYISDPTGSGRDIRSAVEYFAKGYHDAYNGGSPGCPAVQGPPRTIALAVGTDNIYNDLPSGEQSAHAQAWAKMVNTIKNDIIGYTEIKVYAAIDAEPDFGSYSKTSLWAEGYDGTGVSEFYNFGSTDGYPNLATGDPTPEVPRPWGTSGWSTDQFYHISYGLNSALSLPQIYMPQFSRDWNRVKRWSIETSQKYIMYFSGELSECASSPCGIGGNPPARFFKKDEAWQVFWQQLNGDPQTHQYITYSTDIKCSNGNTNIGCTP